MAAMNLLKRIVVSSMRIKGLCFVGLFAISILIANDAVVVAVVGQESNEFRNHQHELLHPSVPNGEKSIRISSINDSELLPWYKDFINLPSDGTFVFMFVLWFHFKQICLLSGAVSTVASIPQFRGQDRHG
jgi:hypothetical protein